jgi:hypothetical protein
MVIIPSTVLFVAFDQSDLPDEKHFEHRISSVKGIIIDRSADDENADDSIRVDRAFSSNETDERKLHNAKQFEVRISMFVGISTCDELGKL